MTSERLAACEVALDLIKVERDKLKVERDDWQRVAEHMAWRGGEGRKPDRDRFIDTLRNIYRNDATEYGHHQPRRWDGKKPSGGTIWLTPRELAAIALQRLGEPAPDALEEMKAKHVHP